MTNRKRIIDELSSDNDDALVNFMCPFIPGEQGAKCTDPDNAEWQTHCKACIKGWLDSESDEPKGRRGKRIVIEISGADIDKIDADGLAEMVYERLENDGYDVTVTGSEDD